MHRNAFRFFAAALIGAAVLCSAGAGATDIAELRQWDADGEPLLKGQIVTFEGVAVVDSGRWHDSANYFAVVDSGEFPKGVMVYLPGTVEPTIQAGDRVRVSGQLGLRGYSTDIGSLVVIPKGPEDVQIVGKEQPELRAFGLSTDAPDSKLHELQVSYVRIEGRVSNYRNSGIVRGFWVDGSGDGEIEDRKGTMYVKFYNYAGINIDHLHSGSYVVVKGILMKADENHGRYYIRPTRQEDIIEIPEKTRPPAPDELPGMTFDLGERENRANVGLFQLVNLITPVPLSPAMYPAWKPDGSGIAVTLGKETGARAKFETAEANLFLVNFTGGVEPKQLTYEFFPHASPRWNPDGRELVYAGAPGIDGPDGNWDLFRWDLSQEAVLVASSPANEFAPAWMGDELVYTSDARGNLDIYWQSSEGEVVDLTSSPADESFPDWSSHGIVFQRRGQDGRFDIWRAEVVWENGYPTLADEVCLTEDLNGSSIYGRWSPDGEKVAFMSSAFGSWDIWLMDKSGEGKTRLTSLPGGELYPAWDPTGRRLAFVSVNPDAELWVLDLRRAQGAEHTYDRPLPKPALALGLPEPLPNAPIGRITWPLLTCPAFVGPGDEIVVEVRDIDTSQAQLYLISEEGGRRRIDIEPRGSSIRAAIPDNVKDGVYGILLEAVEERDHQPRAVVVKRDTTRLTFAVIADVHLNNEYVGDENGYLREIAEELNVLGPDFAVFLGDLVGKSADNYAEEYPQIYELIRDKVTFPVFAVMGNHDGRVSGTTDGFLYWQSYLGPLYHSIEIGGWTFLFLNTYDRPQFPSDNGVMGGGQLAWLEGRLRDSQERGRPTVAFLHHNPFDTRWVFMDEGREELANLLEVYGVYHVFAGHRHTDQLEYTPVTAITTTRTAQNGDREEVGYRIVTIDGPYLTSYRRTSSVISAQ